jgi:hypothetical protein
MNITASIKFNAALLFVVFASNTILGFACAVGVDKALIKRIIHHIGNVEATESCSRVYDVDKGLHHDDDKKAPEKDCRCNNEKDDCCNKKVVAFEHLDKTVTQPVAASFALPFIELPPFLSLNSRIYSATSITVLNHIIRNLHPPPEDIRVSIRSFQI